MEPPPKRAHITPCAVPWDNDAVVLVVARYAEDLGWLKRLLETTETCVDYTVIVNKGKPLKLSIKNSIELSRPNEGREGETYLTFITQFWDSLPKHTIFIQGDPRDHSPDFEHLLSPHAFEQYRGRGFQPLTCQWKPHHPPRLYEEDFKGPYQIRTPTGEFYRIAEIRIRARSLQFAGRHAFADKGTVKTLRNLAEENKIPPQDNIAWLIDKCRFTTKHYVPRPDIYMQTVIGACFCVDRDLITSNQKECYVSLRDTLLAVRSHGGANGYLLERAWWYIFEGRICDTTPPTTAKPLSRKLRM